MDFVTCTIHADLCSLHFSLLIEKCLFNNDTTNAKLSVDDKIYVLLCMESDEIQVLKAMHLKVPTI